MIYVITRWGDKFLVTAKQKNQKKGKIFKVAFRYRYDARKFIELRGFDKFNSLEVKQLLKTRLKKDETEKLWLQLSNEIGIC